MMHENASQSLVTSSKEKELPPIPPPDSETLLLPKSLNRKNVKKLLFVPTSTLNDPPHSIPSLALNEFRQSPVHKSSASRGMTQSLSASLENLDIAPSSIRGSSAQRKLRTVVSSMSPTKSSQNSPSLRSSPMPSTPLATTSSAHSLRDEDLVHLKNLGSGNSGVVLKVLHVPLQKTMARKVVLVDLKPAVQEQIIRELRIMHECRLPYIIEFYGAFLRSNNSIVMCMEYCNCGSLDNIVKLSPLRQLPTYVLRQLLYLVLSGLIYLYKYHKIIHRDIKPLNVLMTHKGNFKLCDFGVSRELTNSVAMADTFVGTSTYMSPERIQGLVYGIKSDVWSMGLMLYELACGTPVWSGDDDSTAQTQGPEGILDLLQRIVNEDSPTLTNKINRLMNEPYDSSLCSFVDSCLIKDEVTRKSPQDLMTHGFLKGASTGAFEQPVKAWAKSIRKLHRETYGKE